MATLSYSNHNDILPFYLVTQILFNPVASKVFILGGFPGGSVVENPAANAGDTGSSPDPERSHMLWSNLARAPQLLSLCSRGRELLLSSRATTTEAHTPQSPCSAKREVMTMSSLGITTREQPLLSATTKKSTQQQRPMWSTHRPQPINKSF